MSGYVDCALIEFQDDAPQSGWLRNFPPETPIVRYVHRSTHWLVRRFGGVLSAPVPCLSSPTQKEGAVLPMHPKPSSSAGDARQPVRAVFLSATDLLGNGGSSCMRGVCHLSSPRR